MNDLLQRGNFANSFFQFFLFFTPIDCSNLLHIPRFLNWMVSQSATFTGSELGGIIRSWIDH
ncbi:MAG: hypothetical protein OEU92_26040, partial [Alphaproteobacteria bacterium]|nr:hypothetical protein [Alphaproteobacteria bacterium]